MAIWLQAALHTTRLYVFNYPTPSMYPHKSILQESLWTPVSASRAHILKSANDARDRAREAVNYSDRISRESMALLERSTDLLERARRQI